MDEQHGYRALRNRDRRFRGAGGTSGGLGCFLIGLALLAAGGYLILQRAHVVTGFWGWWGTSAFGLTLLPLLIGIGLIFFNGRSSLGWLLVALGTLIIFVGVITNLRLYFPHTSLFDFLVMVVLFMGGLGLMARSVLTGT